MDSVLRTCQRNRYWLAENFLSPIFNPVRESIYLYHIQGLDQFLEDLGRSVAASQQRDLVLHQRMPDEREVRVQRAGVHVRQATNFARMAEYRPAAAG